MDKYISICGTCKYCDLEFQTCQFGHDDDSYGLSVDPSDDACGNYVPYD